MPNLAKTVNDFLDQQKLINKKTISAGGPGSGRHPEFGKMSQHLKENGYKYTWQHPTKPNVQVFSTAPKSQGTSEQVHVHKGTASYKQVMYDNGKVNHNFDNDGGKGLAELQDEIQ